MIQCQLSTKHESISSEELIGGDYFFNSSVQRPNFSAKLRVEKLRSFTAEQSMMFTARA